MPPSLPADTAPSKAAVWRNETETAPMFNTTVSRSYKDGEAWKDSASFGYDDVLIVAELLRTCHGFISPR